MAGTDIRTHVASHYAEAVRALASEAEAATASCCGPDGCGSAPSAPLYAEDQVSTLPESVTNVSFGCGNPTALASLQPGETVLDLGSGGGIDCFLAAAEVGPGGRVFGVDMTPDMVGLARRNAAKVAATNVEFRLGEIEHLPLPDESVDVVISNCVINLSPEKEQVFREAFRVLRPGGRLQVSDIVWAGPRPEPATVDMDSWAACVAGALPRAQYLAAIEGAGFTGITVDMPALAEPGPVSADVIARKP